ncbi:protein REDOX 2 [Sesamum angolense]|uniref:Protein REDOX 2 n=1 Tax=Sesamum angolense TaxID=2727404 RepID=A0AAE1WLZ5_9LAMI|nr:protein REDOX 2 [Sesamum angolense]
MDKVGIPEVVLNSGHKMPAIGLGTGGSTLPLAEQLPLLVEAIAAGYRHFDTATLYGTEEIVGQAVAEALGRGLIKSRDELFITTKLWCTDADHDLVLPAINESLRNLGAMEECYRMGLAKSIGVSNYSCAKLSTLLENATIPPAVNQVEMNVAWQQQKLMEFCKDKGIHVCAFSPLGAYGFYWGNNAVMESPILKDIAVAKNKTVAQVALRWIRQQGGIPIVRSFNKERMKQNLQIFDWELTDEEVGKIQQIPQLRSCYPTDLVGPHAAQYRSLEELWDGEI